MLDQLLAPDIKSLLDEGNLESILEFFSDRHPTEIAEILTGLEPEDALKILKALDKDLSADVLSELPSSYQVDLTDLLSEKELASYVERMEPDDRVDMLKAMPDRVEDVLPVLDKEEQEEIRQLAQYPEGTAGSIMTTDYVAVPAHLKVSEAIEKIRHEGAPKESLYTIFVIDTEGCLVGSISLADLILANPGAKLADIMDEQVHSVVAMTDREEALYLFSRYDLVSLPVVDDERHLIGIITHDDAIDVLEAERTEDIERFMAISGKHEDTTYLHTSVWDNFRHRVLWLVILAAAGLLSGAVLQSFEETLTSLLILAFYMPMLADTGGNTGSQSATVVVRALALKEITPKDALKVIWKELRIGLLLGLVLGVLAFVRVLLTGGGVSLPGGIDLSMVGLAIAIALSIQVITATLIGALLPLGAAALHLDPALIASPALTTVVDITGLFIYFSTAKAILHL
ncbi:MAG: magnesium transporter [Spirochaetaceae bacterium]|nr:magnesium transporter [Spirochaetaceae bacterium]